jgi:hypothetical protein
MSIEQPSTEHDLVEVFVVLQHGESQVVFVCRCSAAFGLITEFRTHRAIALRESNENVHPPAWKKIEHIALASDEEILDELRCWNELDCALREIEAQQNKPE